MVILSLDTFFNASCFSINNYLPIDSQAWVGPHETLLPSNPQLPINPRDGSELMDISAFSEFTLV